MAECRRCARRRRCREPQHADGSLLELVVPVNPREPQEEVREHRVARGRRVVVELLLAVDELLAVGRRVEEAAVLLVGEELRRKDGEPSRLSQPTQVAGRDMQLAEPVRHIRVVLEEPSRVRTAVAPCPKQPAVVVRQRAEQELTERNGRCEEIVALEPSRGFGERRERQSVP